MPAQEHLSGDELACCVVAAKLGWGRLEEINLGTAVLLEVLRRATYLDFEPLCETIWSFSRDRKLPIIDEMDWDIQARLEALEEARLVKKTADGAYCLTAKAWQTFGDSNCRPQRGPRSAEDPRVYVVQQPLGETG